MDVSFVAKPSGRHRAGRLALFPFQSGLFNSDVMENNLSALLTNLEPGAKTYIESMQDFENNLFLGVNANNLFLYDVLAIDRPNPDPLKSTLHAQSSTLCSVILAYRLVEEIAKMAGSPKILKAVTYPRQFGVVKLKHFDTLSDLTTLSDVFVKATKQIALLRIEEFKAVGPLAHIKTLCKLQKVNDSTKIMMNINIAALHLSYLLQHSFCGALPDLPESSREYIKTLERVINEGPAGSEDFNEEIQFLNGLFKDNSQTNKGHLCATLNLGLMLTPLIWLVPVELHKKKWSRMEINRVAAMLGNSRPDQIDIIERMIFKVVYRIALNELDIISGTVQISKFLNDVVQKGALFKNDVRYWFDLKPIPADSNSSITEVGGNSSRKKPNYVDSSSQPMDVTHGKQVILERTSAANEVMAKFFDFTMGHPSPENEAPMNDIQVTDTNTPQQTIRREAKVSEKPSRMNEIENDSEYNIGDVNNPRQSNDMDVTPDRNGNDDAPEITNENDHVRDITEENNGMQIVLDEDDEEDEIEDTDDDVVQQRRVSTRKKKASIRPAADTKHPQKRKRTSDQKKERDPQRRRIADKKRPIKQAKAADESPSEIHSESPSESDDVIVIDFESDGDTDNEQDIIDSDRLQLSPKPDILRGNKFYTVYGPTEDQASSFSPMGYNQTDIAMQEEFLESIHEAYINEKPPHLSEPDSSAFCCLTSKEFYEKSVEEIQTIFSKKNIVLYDCPRNNVVQFDEQGFYSIVSSLDQKVDVQDQSIPADKDTYHNRVKRGTPQQILQAHRQTDGKILNALNFPGLRLTYPDVPLSSDLIAWDATHYRNMSNDENYPIRSMRWFLAATKAATHMWHLDSNGTCTTVSVDCGSKCWIIVYPKDENAEESFANIDLFLPPDFETAKACKEKWRLEAIMLMPGSQLFMRPNTPHAVFTTESSICNGGHFYCISTMQQTTASLIHSFVTGSVTTNTNHDTTRPILRRMAELCYLVFIRKKLLDNPRALLHVPKLDNLDGILHLLSLCNIVIFGNVLDGRTYQAWQETPWKERTAKQKEHLLQYDQGSLSLDQRKKYSHARGMALQVLLWVACSFDVASKDQDGNLKPVDDVLRYLVFGYLVQQGCAIIAYKEKADEQDVAGFPGCTIDELSKQLDAVFSLNSTLKFLWTSSAKDRNEAKYSSLLWSGDKDLIFTKKDTVQLSGEFKVVDFGWSGTTLLDRKFVQSVNCGFR